jgi:hypothetical protein
VVYESADRFGGDPGALQGRDDDGKFRQGFPGLAPSGAAVDGPSGLETGVVDLSASGRVSDRALLTSGEAEDRSWWKAFRPAGRLLREAVDPSRARATGSWIESVGRGAAKNP